MTNEERETLRAFAIELFDYRQIASIQRRLGYHVDVMERVINRPESTREQISEAFMLLRNELLATQVYNPNV